MATPSPSENSDVRLKFMNLTETERLQRIREKNAAYSGVNGAIRADLARFSSIGTAWATLDDATMKRIREYFAYHALSVRTHHHGQVEHFAPKIEKIFPDFAKEAQEVLFEQHETLEKLLLDLERAFAENRRNDLAQLFTTYQDTFLKHLAEEEVGQLLLRERMSDEQYKEIMQEYLKEMAKDDNKMHIEWALAGMDKETRKKYLKKLPFIVPLLWHLLWQRRYRSKVEVFRQFGA